MSETLVYFPGLQPADGAWTCRVLLYWDKLSLILPEGAGGPSLDLQELAARRLVEFTSPSIVTESPRYVSAFLELLEQVRQSELFGRLGTTRILTGKIPDRLVEELARQRLAIAHGGEFEVERITGLLYMTYLAHALAEELDAAPVTDGPEPLALLAKDVPAALARPERALERLRAAILDRVLPVPEGVMYAAKLAPFRERHESLLRRFREAIELEIREITQSPPEFWDEMARSAGRRLSDHRDEIAGQMTAGLGRPFYWSLVGVAAAAGPAAAGAHDAVAASFQLPAILLAVRDAVSAKRSRRDISREPLAFAAYATRELVR